MNNEIEDMKIVASLWWRIEGYIRGHIRRPLRILHLRYGDRARAKCKVEGRGERLLPRYLRYSRNSQIQQHIRQGAHFVITTSDSSMTIIAVYLARGSMQQRSSTIMELSSWPRSYKCILSFKHLCPTKLEP